MVSLAAMIPKNDPQWPRSRTFDSPSFHTPFVTRHIAASFRNGKGVAARHVRPFLKVRSGAPDVGKGLSRLARRPATARRLLNVPLSVPFKSKNSMKLTSTLRRLATTLALGVSLNWALAQTPSGSSSWTELRDVQLLEDLVRVRVANGKTNEPAGVIRQYINTAINPRSLTGIGSTNVMPMTINGTRGIRKIESVVDTTRRFSVRDQTVRILSHDVRRAPQFSIGDLRLQWQKARTLPKPGEAEGSVRSVAPLTIQGRMNNLEIDRVVKTPSIEIK